MNMRPNPQVPEPDDATPPPEALVEGLRRLRPTPPGVTAERDRQILSACQAELTVRLATKTTPEHAPGGASETSAASRPKEEGRRFIVFPWPRLGWATAAAAALVLGLVCLPWNRPPGLALSLDLQSPTVLDAFALARHLEAGAVRDPRLDANQDGQVDDTDVTWLVQRAVRLPPEDAR